MDWLFNKPLLARDPATRKYNLVVVNAGNVGALTHLGTKSRESLRRVAVVGFYSKGDGSRAALVLVLAVDAAG